jgi:hypothetical protein
VDRALVQAQTTKLLDASLVQLSMGEDVSIIVMPIKNFFFGNWTKYHMCGHYCPMNKQTYLDKYAMALIKKDF